MSILKKVYLSLGGNIGDARSTLESALKEISRLPHVQSLKTSRYYQTAPVGNGPPQNDFINCVAEITTSLPAITLLKELQKIESYLGKIPKPKNFPRIIDIDILFYGAELYNNEELEIPHPRWKERLFVLLPLYDLVDKILIPDSQQVVEINVGDLVKSNPNDHSVKLIDEESKECISKNQKKSKQ